MCTVTVYGRIESQIIIINPCRVGRSWLDYTASYTVTYDLPTFLNNGKAEGAEQMWVIDNDVGGSRQSDN